MKVLFVISGILASIIGFLYLCKKLGLDVNQFLTQFFDSLAPSQSQTLPQNPYSIYQVYQSDYEHFGDCVWACLVSLQSKCNLDCTGNKSKIYCADVVNRVKFVQNRILFTYEIRVDNRCYIKDANMVIEKIDLPTITNSIRVNLPAYMDGGYYYQGNIYVWDIGKGRIAIEIHDVCRRIDNMGGIII